MTQENVRLFQEAVLQAVLKEVTGSPSNKYIIYMWPKEEDTGSKKKQVGEAGHLVAIVDGKIISDMFRAKNDLFYEPKEVSVQALRSEL